MRGFKQKDFMDLHVAEHEAIADKLKELEQRLDKVTGGDKMGTVTECRPTSKVKYDVYVTTFLDGPELEVSRVCEQDLGDVIVKALCTPNARVTVYRVED